MLIDTEQRKKELEQIILKSRKYYDQILEDYATDFHIIQETLTLLPQPEDIVPTYSYLDESGLSLEEAVDRGKEVLDELVDLNYIRFPGMVPSQRSIWRGERTSIQI